MPPRQRNQPSSVPLNVRAGRGSVAAPLAPSKLAAVLRSAPSNPGCAKQVGALEGTRWTAELVDRRGAGELAQTPVRGKPSRAEQRRRGRIRASARSGDEHAILALGATRVVRGHDAVVVEPSSDRDRERGGDLLERVGAGSGTPAVTAPYCPSARTRPSTSSAGSAG